MARQPTSSRHVYEAKNGKNKFIGAWITSNKHGNIELNVNRLTTTLFSNFEGKIRTSYNRLKMQLGAWMDRA